jgi:hypothetical protein
MILIISETIIMNDDLTRALAWLFVVVAFGYGMAGAAGLLP